MFFLKNNRFPIFKLSYFPLKVRNLSFHSVTSNLTNYSAYWEMRGEDKEENAKLMRTLINRDRRRPRRVSDGSDSGNSDGSAESSNPRDSEAKIDEGVRSEVLRRIQDPEVMCMRILYKNE